MIALCFLIVGKLHNLQCWKQWLADDQDGNVKLYFHVSRPTDEVFMTWAASAGTFIPVIKTQWGHRSLLDAELALYQAAFTTSLASHCILVSETNLPVVTVKRALQVCQRLKDKSALELLHVQVQGSCDWINSTPFKIMSKSCFRDLNMSEVEQLTLDVQLVVDSGDYDLAVDEVVLGTLLVNIMSSKVIICRTTISTHTGFPCHKCDDRQDYCMHAKALTPIDKACHFVKKQKRQHTKALFARKFVHEISDGDFQQLLKL
jgi:hypothetical protein